MADPHSSVLLDGESERKGMTTIVLLQGSDQGDVGPVEEVKKSGNSCRRSTLSTRPVVSLLKGKVSSSSSS